MSRTPTPRGPLELACSLRGGYRRGRELYTSRRLALRFTWRLWRLGRLVALVAALEHERCVYCEEPTLDGSDEHEECVARSLEEALEVPAPFPAEAASRWAP